MITWRIVRERFNITAGVEDAKDFLRGYGAWDDDQLADHGDNIDRLIWIAGGDIVEQGDFYMG